MENKEEIVEGAIAIQPLRRNLPAYNEYFRNLIKTENKRNPWFDEYLEVYHNCSNDANKPHLSHCKEKQAPYREQVYIHFVRDAVYAFAHALHNLHMDLCNKSFSGQNRLCPAFKERVFKDLIAYLAKVSFNDTDENFTFRFYSHNDSFSRGPMPHDGPPRYSVINFSKNESIYDWKNVGTYVNGEIINIVQDFQLRYAPKARNDGCGRKECGLNEIKIPDTQDNCCWHCVDCGDFEYKTSEYECTECPEGQESSIINETLVRCVPIPEV